MKNIAVFDLDGTLNQTNLYAVEAIRLALNDLGVTDISDEIICSHIGACPDDYTKYYFPDGTEEIRLQFLKLETKYENELLKTHGKAFDGVKDSILKLKTDGFSIAVCSNASERYITLVLKTIGLFEYVDEIQPLMPNMTKNETLKILLERTKPQIAFMVGDRIFDKNAANANNIPFVGCAYGYCPEEITDADEVVYHASEIYDAAVKILNDKKV